MSTRSIIGHVVDAAGLEQDQIHHLSVDGVRAWMVIRPREAELRRRGASTTPQLCDRDVLRVLSDLPLGEPVPRVSLSHGQLRLLSRVPGAVANSGGELRRVAQPPLDVAAAVVVDGEWDRGLDRASRFAAFCPRVLLHTGHRRRGFDLMEASYFGIGVAQTGADGEVNLEVPPNYASRSAGPAGWGFAERVAQALGVGSLTATG